MTGDDNILQDLQRKFGQANITPQATCDGFPMLWVPAEKVRDVLRYLKLELDRPYRMLYSLTAIDERNRVNDVAYQERSVWQGYVC